ncbi:MAG: DUF4147 domain-containing protein [Candidatus Hydrothermae bacterium]|nr:DUF4147 domain-containing protein [Candidatus Hydrothermae bacterium]
MDGSLPHPLNALKKAALRAVHPSTLLEEALELRENRLSLKGATAFVPLDQGIAVFGAGKASACMAQALEQHLGTWIVDGLVITKEGHGTHLQRILVREAAHPVPDTRTLEATRELLERLQQQPPGRPVLFLLSGGASSLLELPREGITLEDLQRTTDLLLRSGAPIQAINAVRKHLSRVKGGQLLRFIRGPVWTLVISDVVGNAPEVIGSGPTVPDPSTYQDALDVLHTYHLIDAVPSSVYNLLLRGSRGELPETLKGLDVHPYDTMYHILADPFTAARAAEEEARRHGYHAVILNATVTGQTHEVARFLVDALHSVGRYGVPVPSPACLILAGETTLEVHGSGKGGRNQEFALYAGLLLEQDELDAQVMALGTDGTDGPTDAAGAWISRSILHRARAQGISPEAYLEQQDSYTFFQKIGTQIRTGPTCTNVCDLMVGCVGRPRDI